MKAVVIGNCQARPMATLLQRQAGIDVLGTYVIHLAKADDRAAHEAALAETDVIFAQLTLGSHWVETLRSDYLQQTYPEKTVVWPNIYFRGQQPYLHYLRGDGPGLLQGPMSDYHHLWFLRDWFKERHGIAFADHITEPGYADAVTAASLGELARREMTCDARVQDLIAETYTEQRLLFTFNHPSMWLLARLCERLLAHLGVAQRQIDETAMQQQLARIQPPFSLPRQSGPDDIHQGVAVDLETPGKIALGRVRRYSAVELRQAVFACYDHQQDLLRPETLRLSPT